MANNEINFNVKFSPGKLLFGVLFFTILFPFIPSLIPSSDTQPTFLLFFSCSLFYVLIAYQYQKNYFNLTYNKILIVFLVFGIIIVSVAFARIFISSPVLWTRIISFLQFVFAIFFALNATYFFKLKTLKTVFLVFAAFSVVFLLTNGLIERILIPGRTETYSMLSFSGRGASTFSPEPSFFALHILNLYIVFLLLSNTEVQVKYGKIVFCAASFCLLSSLSGYGFFIFLVLFFARYTKVSLVFLLILLLSSSFILSSLEAYVNFRGVKLLTMILLENPSVIMQDASFVSRFGSFFAYIENIKNYFLIGDGFTLAQGGGFISIVSSLGIIAICFMIFLIIEIFKLPKNGTKIKLILIFWFLINLFSGPIGIPIIGVIIGLIIRINHLPKSFGQLQEYSNKL